LSQLSKESPRTESLESLFNNVNNLILLSKISQWQLATRGLLAGWINLFTNTIK